MKTKWWLIGGIAAALAAGALAVRIWFVSPGIHIFGKEIHVNVSEQCYIIDGLTGEILDETTISIKGATSRSDSEIFEGELKVLGYENSASGTITSLKTIDTDDEGIWRISHLENCTHRETVDGVTKDVEHFCDLHYTYHIDPGNPEWLVVLIESFAKEEPVYAVSAADENAALVAYEAFLEKQS